MPKDSYSEIYSRRKLILRSNLPPLGESERKVRRGIAPQMLAKAFASGLSEISPAHANMRAAMACALQGLLRVGEYCIDSGSAASSGAASST